MALLPSPAHAGHWVLDTTGTTATASPWLASSGWIAPPVTATNSVIIQSDSVGWGTTMPGTITASATMTVMVKGTWTSDTNSDNTPPSSVLVSESSTATSDVNSGGIWKAGSVSDGINAAPQDPITGVVTDQRFVPCSGGSFTVNLSLSATPSATATLKGGIGPFIAGVTASVGPVTIAVHAQPYNMVLSSYKDPSGNPHPAVDIDNVNGILTFDYSISSTDGVLGDLASISAYETLDWSGNPAPPGSYPPGQYIPPSPPVQIYATPTPALYAYKNPDKEVSPYLVQGYVMDRFSSPTTGFAAPLPFPSTVWKVTQNYLFDDSQTGQFGVKIPGPDNNSPFTITRTVTPTNLTGTTGTYSVTTRGATASEAL